MYLFAKLLAGGFVANEVLLINARPVAVKECNGCTGPDQTVQQMHGPSSTNVVTYKKSHLRLEGVLTIIVFWRIVSTFFLTALVIVSCIPRYSAGNQALEQIVVDRWGNYRNAFADTPIYHCKVDCWKRS